MHSVISDQQSPCTLLCERSLLRFIPRLELKYEGGSPDARGLQVSTFSPVDLLPFPSTEEGKGTWGHVR